jgi:long-chain acyl-CoA synthetase
VTVPAQVGVRCGARCSTYPDLFERALRASSALEALGIGAGDRVALLLRNSIEFLEASIATAPLGASAVPINWHWRGDEIAHVLRDSGAKALVLHADLWQGIAASVPEGLVVLVVPSDSAAAAQIPDRALIWREWLAAHEPWSQPPQAAPVSIIYTSGTTGRPKGVVRTPASDEQRQAAQSLIGEIFQLGADERTVIPAPMYHTAPNVYALAAAMRGLDMTLMQSFDAEQFLRIVAERRVTVVQMVPTMFVRLLALPARVRARYDLSSLRWVVHAAAPCPVAVKRAMIDWLGPVVAEYYGGTETGPVTFCTSEQWLAHPGTVGRPLEGATIAILDAEGRPVPTGQSGEVYMWLDVWPDFTYAGDEAKRRSVERDGLVSCGDIGYLDADGYLYLNDRRSDMVISGGVNIYPAEIEACLQSMRGVRDCAVFGIPDEEFGESLAAHIELDEQAELSADAVRAHVRTRLAGYKTPRVVEFSDTLPREDSGKIFKRRLREPYWRDRERAI